ncbi:MAG: outer membrane protein assembly factor BamA [Treponema sp.]|nr:outer membrane protein assembly factor BamA [Treponema sp.]
MQRKLFTLFVLFFLSVNLIYSQDDSEDWFWNKTITEIDFEGLDNVKKSELIGITSSFIDKPFTEEIYSELLDRLYSLEFFEDVIPYAKHHPKNPDDILLVFQVEELPIIKSVNFSGNSKVRNGELREKVKIKASDIFSESKVLVAERALKYHYLEKGFTNSSVTYTTEEKDGEIILTFVINEGENIVIKEINIVGNSVFSARMIKNKLALKEVGLLRDGAFQTSLLEQDKQTIVSYYKEKGYADAAVVDTKTEIINNAEENRQEMYITFYVHEGVQYTYEGLTISGNEVFSTQQLLKCEKLKIGAIYNEVKFQQGLMEISSLYMDNGYMSANIVPIVNKNSEKHTISYNLEITENSRSHVENVIIKGNNKTKEFVISREIQIQPGDVFSRNKVINAYRNLMNLQYFSNVIPEPQQGSEKDLVDVVFTVEEQSTTQLQFGMTFSQSTDPTSLPISLFTKWENSNLFGEGRSISAGLALSTSEQSIDFAYSQRWLGNLPISFTSSISLAHTSSVSLMNMWLPNGALNQTYYYMNYDGYSASLNNSMFRRWYTNYALLSVGLGMTNSLTRFNYDENSYVPIDYSISHYANRWGLSNTLYFSGSVDARDISYYPTKGWFVSERISWSGFIPTVENDFYFKTDTKLEGYFTLFDIPMFNEKWNFKIILAGYTGFTGILPTRNIGVSDNSKLYVDGLFNGRGWTDIYKTSKGLSMFTNRLELRMPIVPNVIGIDGFFDACAVKPTVSDMFTNLTIDDFYFSFGPSVRFLLPQFPLNLLFAWRFTSKGWADTPFQFVLSFNVVNS